MHLYFRKTALFLLKLILILSIFAFLFWQANKNNAFEKLWERTPNGSLLFAAFLAQLFGVSITFLRWRWLVMTLGLPLSYKDAFRLGFLGLLLNLAPMGIVGGDAVKAFLFAKKNPDYQSWAVASVFVDRIVGLLSMFLLGTLLVLGSGFAFREEIWARTASQIVFILTACGFLGVGMVFLPFFAKGHVERLLEKIPFCGTILGKLTRALLLYRNQKRCLFFSFLITFLVHFSFGISLYLAAEAMFAKVPGFWDHIMLHQITNLTSMIPLAAGPYEFVLDQLYSLFTVQEEKIPLGIGFLVAIVFRIVSIFVAGMGIIFYLSARDEINEVRCKE